ncbi:hypothetical protein Y032_0131g1657 [Ancylostoma ceylanicum]|uniref:Uncharacterized protein n=1 Tax=Ancylostoma ceylanicum TaxID=53326 RepID=A0A016T7A9_9BILA|nr:hypothetical protein Y032_0131g1657 [Ancylostoma ceylanicum]
MADDMERGLNRILEADKASKNCIEQLQQQFGELPSKMQVLPDANAQRVTSTIVSLSEKVESIQKLFRRAALALTRAEGAVPPAGVDELLCEYVLEECEALTSEIIEESEALTSEIVKLEVAARQYLSTIYFLTLSRREWMIPRVQQLQEQANFNAVAVSSAMLFGC